MWSRRNSEKNWYLAFKTTQPYLPKTGQFVYIPDCPTRFPSCIGVSCDRTVVRFVGGNPDRHIGTQERRGACISWTRHRCYCCQQQMRSVASLFVKCIRCRALRNGRTCEIPAHGDDANGRILVSDDREKFKSRHARHRQLGEHDIRNLIVDSSDRRRTVLNGSGRITKGAEYYRHVSANRRFIVNNEKPCFWVGNRSPRGGRESESASAVFHFSRSVTGQYGTRKLV